MTALEIPFAPSTTSTLAAAPATTSTLAATIDLGATPRLLTPGAPAPLSKSARAPHGVTGHIHGGMAGRQADVQDASPTCLQSLPADAPAARLRHAGGAAGDSREEMEGAGDADPRRRSILDPVHA